MGRKQCPRVAPLGRCPEVRRPYDGSGHASVYVACGKVKLLETGKNVSPGSSWWEIWETGREFLLLGTNCGVVSQQQ